MLCKSVRIFSKLLIIFDILVLLFNKILLLDNSTYRLSKFWVAWFNSLAPKISSIVIVPNKQDTVFGSLFQIESNSNEIFISGATVENVEVIPSISQGNLKASGTVITSATTTAETASATSGGSTGTSTTSTTTTTTSSGSSSSSGSGSRY